MPEPFEVVRGQWWRFSRYEINSMGGRRYIQPAPKARLSRYDPWEAYRRAWNGQDKRVTTPYKWLLEILQREDIEHRPRGSRDALAPETEMELLGWCSEHGLLGVLVQRVQTVVLAPRWEKLLPARKGSALTPASLCYLRTSRGWQESLIFLPYGNRTPAAVSDETMIGTTVAPEFQSKSWRTPRALVESLWILGFAPKEEELATTWSRFFPSIPANERETYLYPRPLSNSFWHLYAEPIDDFLEGTFALFESLRLLSQTRPLVQLSEDEGASLESGAERLNRLLASVNASLQISEDGSLQQVWRAPSLLSSFALMALQDLTLNNRALLRCAVCSKLFLSRVPQQAAYCSERCRSTAEKRRQRPHPLQ